MKTRFRNLFMLSAICALFAGGLSSCSNDNAPAIEEQKQEVVFQFDAGSVLDTKAATTECGNLPANLIAKIEVKNVGTAAVENFDVPIKMYGTNLKTEPQFLASGTYTVQAVTIHDAANVVYYSGVMPGAEFAKFLPANPNTTKANNSYLMTDQQFKVESYTKPTVILYVLCAKGEHATSFGMPKFQINRIEVTCFDFFINVCEEGNNFEHEVGSGYIRLYAVNPNGSKGAMLYEDGFHGAGYDADGNANSAIISGDLATICYADDKTVDDANEKFIVDIEFTWPISNQLFTSNEITVAELNTYLNTPAAERYDWDVRMNAVHIEIGCGPTPFCLERIFDPLATCRQTPPPPCFSEITIGENSGTGKGQPWATQQNNWFEITDILNPAQFNYTNGKAIVDLVVGNNLTKVGEATFVQSANNSYLITFAFYNGVNLKDGNAIRYFFSSSSSKPAYVQPGQFDKNGNWGGTIFLGNILLMPSGVQWVAFHFGTAASNSVKIPIPCPN